MHRKLIKTNVRWISLFDGTKQENALPAAPILFHLQLNTNDPVHERLLNWVAERGTYTSSMMFLASPLPLLELARRLTARLNATVSGGMDVLLRFYDPRVFERLVSILTSRQKDLLFGVGTLWWFTDRQGKLTDVSAIFHPEDQFEPPLELTAQDETALLDASEPDQVDDLLRKCVPDEYSAVSLRDRHNFVTGQIRVAREFGVVATHELALFCALALRHGEGFERAPQWSRLFEEIKSGAGSMTQAVAGNNEISSRA